MKRLYYMLMVFAMCFTISCSNDDESSSNESEIAQKLIGTWGDYGGNEFYKKFTFRSDSKVEYYTYPNGEPVLEEVGDWSMDGDILTMVYPENVVLTFVQKIVFINDNTVQFVEVSGSGHEAWEGTYSREGSVPNDSSETSFNLQISGRYQTDWCEITSNVSNITFEFLENNAIESSYPTQGNNQQTTTLNRDLSGNIIGIRLKLTDYNPDNLDASKGDGFDNLNLKITNNLTNNVVNDTNLTTYLVSCTDIIYALEIYFDTNTTEIVAINGYYDTND